MQMYLIFFLCITFSYASTPDYFPQCKRSDPDIEQCILEGVEAIKPKLKDGIPEIKVPPLEPFKMEKIVVNTSVIGATINAKIRNVVARGGSGFKIESMKVDLNNTYAAELKLSFPRLRVTADYNTQGSRILLIPINGDGKFEGTLDNVEVVAKGVASPVMKEDAEYLQLDSITTQVTIGEGDLNVIPSDNSFTGKAAASFIRWNPSAVLKVLRPVVDETAAIIVKQYLNDILSSVPLKDFLTDE